MKGTRLISNFVDNQEWLFGYLKENVAWDERMLSRKTASFGIAYNYSHISYPNTLFPAYLEQLAVDVEQILGFLPNNCLVNYYINQQSKMGYHSDRTDVLDKHTGVAVISLGGRRAISFRKKQDFNDKQKIMLPEGSLFYMEQSLQNDWEHSIPACPMGTERISLTFRKLKTGRKQGFGRTFFIL